MIKLEKLSVSGFNIAIRGMRNPLNSWEKSDSKMTDTGYTIGQNDMQLIQKLIKAGTDHRKFLRMIQFTIDITAPLYWWKEFDTYRMGVEKNSCSTMHTIHKKPFTMDDFSFSRVRSATGRDLMVHTITALNVLRDIYENGGKIMMPDGNDLTIDRHDKNIWDEIIQLLPSSYNQKRTVLISYEAAMNMYYARCHHKLIEWKGFCDFMLRHLPYFEYFVDPNKEYTIDIEDSYKKIADGTVDNLIGAMEKSLNESTSTEALTEKITKKVFDPATMEFKDFTIERSKNEKQE